MKIRFRRRIVKPGQVTPAGFTSAQVQVPPGKHLLVFQIEDERQRMAEVELRFEAQ